MSENDAQRLDLIYELRQFSRYELCISNGMPVSTFRALDRLETVLQDTIHRLITKEIDIPKVIIMLHELYKFHDNFWGKQAKAEDYENLMDYLDKVVNG